MATRENVYCKFGITAEAAQLLETSLGTLLLSVEGLLNGWHEGTHGEEAAVALERIERRTVGTLLKELQKLVKFEGDLPALFSSALKTRNRLIHGFYERHDFKIQTDEGRDVMMADLEEMHTELFNAWRVAEAMCNPIHLKVDELTDYDGFDDERLRRMRRMFEKIPIIVAGPRLAAFVEKRWPSLAGKIHRLELDSRGHDSQ